MGEDAVRKHSINPCRSYMVGDSDADMEFGRRMGCRTFRVGKGATFTDAVDFILEDASSRGFFRFS
jgi:histidinol phosphatase-like enzyme